MRPTWVYVLRCADGSYYTGSYRGEDIATRVSEHNMAFDKKSYTSRRRPVELVWADTFELAQDAINFERQIKGWNRKKKEALIRGDWDVLPKLSKRGALLRMRGSLK